LAVQILTKGRALTDTITEIGEAYRACYPTDYAAFIKLIKDESGVLTRPTGMSDDGTMMNFMKIPMATNSLGERINLYSFIKQQMRKLHGIDDFFADRNNYYLLRDIWRDAQIRRQKPARLDKGALNAE